MDESEVARFLTAWFTVRQFIQSANFNHFHQAGLSATQFMILNVLPTGGEGMNIGSLAKSMNLKPATVAKTVDSLETRGMLRRVKSEQDRRVVLVQITERGQELQNAAAERFRNRIDIALRNMKARGRSAFINGLEAFASALDAQSTREGGRLSDSESAETPATHSSRRSRQP